MGIGCCTVFLVLHIHHTEKKPQHSFIAVAGVCTIFYLGRAEPVRAVEDLLGIGVREQDRQSRKLERCQNHLGAMEEAIGAAVAGVKAPV